MMVHEFFILDSYQQFCHVTPWLRCFSLITGNLGCSQFVAVMNSSAIHLYVTDFFLPVISQWVNWIMSYIDLASCWEKLRGEGSWRLLESLTCSLTSLSRSWCPVFSPLFPSISSKILAANPLVTAQASEDETWYSGKDCCRLDHLQNTVARCISFPGFPGLSQVLAWAFLWSSEVASLVAQRVKRLPTVRETQVRSLHREDTLEKEMATHSSTLAWKIPWTEEPGRL